MTSFTCLALLFVSPGFSIALTRQGELVWTGAFGLARVDIKRPVKE